MPTDYPTSLDSLTNPDGADYEDSETVPHAGQHANSNDAIEALQTKLGIDSSADTSSIDYFLKHASGTFESHNHSNNGAQIVEAGIANDAVGPTKIAETGWGSSSGEMLNYVLRDAIDSDFDETDLTLDATANNLDLSSIVSSTATIVSVGIQARDDADSYLIIRGTNDTFSRGGIKTDSTDQSNQYAQFMVPLDSNKEIVYQASNTTWSALDIYVCGWWEPAHT